MMAGNPNWWSMNNNGMLHPHDQSIFSANSSNPNQEFPVRSWSQLLLGGISGTEEERYGANLFQQQKKLENWEDQVLNLSPSFSRVPGGDVKHEVPAVAQSSFPHGGRDDEFQAAAGSSNCWPPPPAAMPVSSPTSCITNNVLNFSSAKSACGTKNQEHSPECNSSMTSGGVSKKARVQQSSAQPALKVRKEKLGDRITALHQLVSPFGKTDTASVLSEAIGYIRFLQGQIEALSSPYMRNTSTAASTGHHHQHSFLNDVGLERGVLNQGRDSSDGEMSDLRSRGLCLVPVSCTQHMAGADSAVAGSADYCWAPAALGGSGF